MRGGDVEKFAPGQGVVRHSDPGDGIVHAPARVMIETPRHVRIVESGRAILSDPRSLTPEGERCRVCARIEKEFKAWRRARDRK